jgi:hypothetical protein
LPKIGTSWPPATSNPCFHAPSLLSIALEWGKKLRKLPV